MASALNPYGTLAGGLVVGAAAGVFVGLKLNQKKLRAEIQAAADAEIADMAEHYHRKELALESRVEKAKVEGKVEQIVAEEKYVSDAEIPPAFRLPAPVPISPTPTVTNVEPPGPVEDEPTVGQLTGNMPPVEIPEWHWGEEMAKRRSGFPYIIHQQEAADELPGYNTVSYAYYPEDNVLADEDDEQVQNVEEVVGVEALMRFGHGAEDPNVVFVRNDKLHLHIEIVRLPERSYEVDVLGLSNAPES